MSNKAAKNLSTLAHLENLDLKVRTIAQLLKQQPEIDEETGEEVFQSTAEIDWSGYGVIVIDEFSMVSRENYQAIALEIKNSILSKVVFVGDPAQLPPVGEKEPVVSSASEIECSHTLTKVVRYEGEIAKVAQLIRSNSRYGNYIYPFSSTSDSTIVCLPKAEWLERGITLFKSQEFEQNPDYIRFLAWRNKTVDGLNSFVRRKIWGENVPNYVPGDRLIAKRPGERKNVWEKRK
jgi:hypothetical protein